MGDDLKLFYLVSEDDFTLCEKSKHENDFQKLSEHPDRVAKKAEKLLLHLQKQCQRWNVHGITITEVPEMQTHFNLIDFVIYSVVTKRKPPLHFESFLKYLTRMKCPLNLVSKKIQKKLIKLENKLKKHEEKET